MKKITEEKILLTLQELETQEDLLNKKLSKMRKSVLDTESDLIEVKIKISRLREELRVYRKITPNYTPSSRELEIKGFRERNPELVEFVRVRDEIKEDE
jgi:hypothetical protein